VAATPGTPKRGIAILAVVVAVLLTLASVSFVFVSPRVPRITLSPQTTVFTSSHAIEDPVLSPDGTHVAFSNNASGNFEIWQSTLQGTETTRLTYMQGDSGFPAYSPDGKHISFYHNDGASGEFVLINSDGTGMRVLSDGPASDEFSAWNPGGSSIAFDEMVGGQPQVVVLGIGSGDVVFRTNGSSPAWSQDGRLLAFEREGIQTSVVYVTNLNGNTSRLLSSEGLILYPRFFKNSTAIVYLSCVNDSWAIESFRLRDGVVSNLLRAPVGGLLLQTWRPEVSSGSVPIVKPDGTSVMFSGRINQSLMDVFEVIPYTTVKVPAGALTVKYPGTILNRLTNTSYDFVGVPSWSSSSKSIIFPVKDSSGMYELILLSYSPPKQASRYG
jgi:Tol biopolymer transport system component